MKRTTFHKKPKMSMRRTKVPPRISLIRQAVRAYHSCYSKEQIEQMQYDRLCCLLHPSDRVYFNVVKEQTLKFW